MRRNIEGSSRRLANRETAPTLASPFEPGTHADAVLDQRGQLLRGALGFSTLPLPSYDRALHALRTWLDSWAGIGHVSVGMAHQGFDLQLTRYDERGWRATFCTTGMEQSPTSATGTGWERTPWHATQLSAWEQGEADGSR
jgi:hypothetical protein